MATKLETPDTDLIELSGKWVYEHPIVDQKLRVNGTIYQKLRPVSTTKLLVLTT